MFYFEVEYYDKENQEVVRQSGLKVAFSYKEACNSIIELYEDGSIEICSMKVVEYENYIFFENDNAAAFSELIKEAF